jgi:hypothetical protein
MQINLSFSFFFSYFIVWEMKPDPTSTTEPIFSQVFRGFRFLIIYAVEPVSVLFRQSFFADGSSICVLIKQHAMKTHVRVELQLNSDLNFRQ